MLHLSMLVVYTKAALKQLKAISPPASKTIRAKIDQYAADPSSLINQTKTLKGSGLLRLRVGDYRVIFTVDGVVMMIIKIGHRRDIYN